MTYTITKNERFNSLEITFDGKPSEGVRDALKALKFRWNGKRGLWYGFATEDQTRAAIEGQPVTQEAPKIDKATLRAEFAKAWKGDKMIDYCTNKVAAVAVLPRGEIVTVDKQSIETRFCFGESGYDYEDAQKAAQHARTSADYFKRENMASFTRRINELEEACTLGGRYLLTINDTAHMRQSEDCRLRSIALQPVTKVLDDLGGSAYVDKLPGQTITEAGSGRTYRIATVEEIGLILDAYKAAATAHEKKVDAYLKRYGLAKVHAWTYWLDA